MIFLLLDVITDSSSVFNTDYEYVIIFSESRQVFYLFHF